MTDSLLARTVVPLQRGIGHRPPVYCFHPFGGSASVYGTLAQTLGPSWTVYGVQAAGLTAGTAPDRTVPSMARRYAAEIGPGRAVLLGYSMGGVLALETARLLGGAVTVVLVDAEPTYRSTNDGGWHVLVRQVLDLDMPTGPLMSLPRTDALAAVRAEAASRGRLPARFGLDRLDRIAVVGAANERAAGLHRPARYPGTVHSLRGRGADPAPDPWLGTADRVVVHLIDAGHHELLALPGSRRIAEVLAALSSP